eukprot:GHVS01025216.1.p1 GENE.GHVS01025216.1~~GHVS01025216.1.p1  ORF type:complete len:174 (+),score=12.39 GHVS01025216.1:639-1160(+)
MRMIRYEEVPYEDIRYIFGEIMYGGHITDGWDRRTNNTYLEILIVPELLTGINLAPGFKSPDSAKFDHAQYVKTIEEKLPAESPLVGVDVPLHAVVRRSFCCASQMFGLHPNAEIGYLTQQGEAFFLQPSRFERSWVAFLVPEVISHNACEMLVTRMSRAGLALLDQGIEKRM